MRTTRMQRVKIRYLLVLLALLFAVTVCCATAIGVTPASASEQRSDVVAASGDQWWLNKIGALEAQSYTTGDEVIVGVLDTGIDASHPALTDSILRSNPHNEQTSLHRDFFNGGTDGNVIVEPTDTEGHGTHVAGIICAQAENLLGVAPNVKLVSLKITDNNGDPSTRCVINAINYAQSKGIRLLSFSGSVDDDEDLKKAINNFDGLLIVAAGNGKMDLDYGNLARYPVCYDNDNIIGVGATDKNDKRSSWGTGSGSNYGKTSVDLFAPGTDIVSTYPNNAIKSMNGTSMATPMVTGTAALLMSLNPSLTAAQVKHAILSTVTYVNESKDDCVTGGRLNAEDAVKSVFGLTATANSTGVTITGFLNGDRMPQRVVVPSHIKGEPVTAIGANVFKGRNVREIVLPNTLRSIEYGAFEDCVNLQTVNLPAGLQNIEYNAFKNCKVLNAIQIPSSLNFVGAGAFAGCGNLNISVSDDSLYFSASDNVLYDKHKTKIAASGKILATLTVPDSVTEVAAYAFYDNSNLHILRFGENTPIIGDRAFADCDNLNAAYFYSFSTPDATPDSFENDSFTAYVPYIKQGDYNLALNENAIVASVQTKINYVIDGQTVHEQDVYYGSYLYDIYQPVIVGYDFNGWYRSASLQGNAVQQGELIDTTDDVYLYAKKTPTQYDIVYNLHGGTNAVGNPSKYTINDNVTFASPTKTGYTFKGWKRNGVATNGIVAGTFGTVTVDADWQANTYTVTLDNNGGLPSTATKYVTFDESFVVEDVPARTGYVLEGWYDRREGGRRVVAADGQSVSLWTTANNAVLYAHWKIKSYTIRINGNGTVTWIGKNGLSNEPCEIEYGTIISSINLIAVFKSSPAGYKEGHIFTHFEYNNAEVNWQSVPDLGDDGATITIYPQWAKEVHTVYFQTRCEILMPSVSVEFDAAINLPAVNRDGYIFNGWYTQATGGERVTWVKMPDLTPNQQANGSRELYAQYTSKMYSVTLDRQGGYGGTVSLTATYDSNLPTVSAPQKTGYNFAGYYTKPNGQGTRLYDKEMLGAKWTIASNTTLYAHWTAKEYSVVLDFQGGRDGTGLVTATFNSPLKTVSAPTRKGYDFKGYYSTPNGQGAKYYDEQMRGTTAWTTAGGGTLYAYWQAKIYKMTIDNGEGCASRYDEVNVTYGQKIPNYRVFAPKYNGHEFVRYYYRPTGQTFYEMELINDAQGATINGYDSWIREGVKARNITWEFTENITLFAEWKKLECYYDYENYLYGEHCINTVRVFLHHGDSVTLTAQNIEGYVFKYFTYKHQQYAQTTVTLNNIQLIRHIEGYIRPQDYFSAVYEAAPNCIAAGSLITLADGTQISVEMLTGNEKLLVWNMFTGRNEAASIVFIDRDATANYKVINLDFSDGTVVKIIDEHGFWDIDLNEYVYLRQDASEYIGHWFNKGGFRVQLTGVSIKDEYTTAYSPVTFGHLCYYVNGMLSMPGGISGLFNIFEVNPDTMTYDSEAMARDIAQYGLFTYDEFAELVPVPEYAFEAFGGQYLKVAIGKGMITTEQLRLLAERYGPLFGEA